MKIYPNQPAKSQAQAIFQRTILYLFAISDAKDEELMDLDVEVAIIKATLSRS